MDDRYRYFLRQWEQLPDDSERRRALDQEIDRMGGFHAGLISTYTALQIRAVAKEVMDQFFSRGVAATDPHVGRLYLNLTPFPPGLANWRPVLQEFDVIVKKGILAAKQFLKISPGVQILQEGLLDLCHPLFLLFLEPSVHITRPEPSIDAITRIHAYPENLILKGISAIAMSEYRKLPLYSTPEQPIPVRELNSIWRPFRDHPLEAGSWSYRFFNPEVYEHLIELVGCHGDGTRQNRGCQQFTRFCICSHMCRQCRHCITPNCGWHTESQCVCDHFNIQQIGGSTYQEVWTHALGYLCQCRGSGWIGTDYDAVYECRIHEMATHHPDCNTTEQDFNECCNLMTPRQPTLPPLPPPLPQPEAEDDLPF